MKRDLTGILYDDGEPIDGYCVYCPELDVMTQGDTVSDAKDMILDAVVGLLATLSPEEVQRRVSLGLSQLDTSDWHEDDPIMTEVGRFEFSVEAPALETPVG